ncbi:Acg family FMN-binding oxidoreductase [Nocardia lasii]|uniref:Acg family FMN-binding oxidoreductase n=1 Tax=Nocardia lasii TaxID=1616107 RepID=A0ABW1JUF5_9NOCA
MSEVRVSLVPDHPTVRAAIRLGCRAPSVHNTQPWRWVFDDTGLHLFGDPDRQLTAADPHGRQAVISCGAMLHHVRTAFASQGWRTETARFPDPTRPNLLATLGFLARPDSPTGTFGRAAAMARRHTERRAMTAPIGWESIRPTLDDLAAAHDTAFDVLDGSARARLTVASEQSEALRHYDMDYQGELRWWAGHPGTVDGVPPSALITESELVGVGVARKFPTPAPALGRSELHDRARLAVLSTTEETPAAWLRTGEALSAVLLECTAAGLATCALTHITEVGAGRRLLSGLLGHPGVPQVVLRIGTAPDDRRPDPTPRRPLAEILTVE